MQKQIEELTLLLMYLNSFEDHELPTVVRRSWKGYSFDAINSLSDQDFIRGSARSKSVMLTESGIAEAQELMRKYLEEDEDGE